MILNRAFFVKLLCLFVIIILSVVKSIHINAKGIPLDYIYIDENSYFYNLLKNTRIDYYENIKARLIDSNVIYANWISGYEIIYIKEKGIKNLIYYYNINRSKRILLNKFYGYFIHAFSSQKKNYIAIKIFSTSNLPRPETKIYNVKENKFIDVDINTANIDFTFDTNEKFLIYSKNNKIYKLNLSTLEENIIIKKSSLPLWSSSNYLYYYNNYIFYISGNSGYYHIFIKQDNLFKKLFTLPATSELYFYKHKIIYTDGNPGNYNVSIYNINNNDKQIISMPGYATSLKQTNNYITFLSNQFINIYNLKSNKHLLANIESDEASISYNGFYLYSIIYKKLFIIHSSNIIKSDSRSSKYLKRLKFIYKKLLRKTKYHKSTYSKIYIKEKLKTIDIILNYLKNK